MKKVFEMTLLKQTSKGALEIKRRKFLTQTNTVESAIKDAKDMFPDYIVIPTKSISLKPRGLFWFGAAVGFAIAFILVSIAAGYFAYKLSH